MVCLMAENKLVNLVLSAYKYLAIPDSFLDLVKASAPRKFGKLSAAAALEVGTSNRLELLRVFKVHYWHNVLTMAAFLELLWQLRSRRGGHPSREIQSSRVANLLRGLP